MPIFKEQTMNLIRRNANPLGNYRPAHLDDQFGRMVESMFDDFFAPFAPMGSMSRASGDNTIAPRLNVVETDKAFEIEAELPGVNKEDIKVAVDNQRVTIEAESKRESAQNEGENVVYAERSSRKYLRSF